MTYRCLSTFVEVDEPGYSTGALRRLSNGRRFPHELEQSPDDLLRDGSRICSLRLYRGRLSPAKEGEGEYLLKPAPRQELPRFSKDLPANENLTMQLASQVFGIATAANACIFLASKQLAYITRRFDHGPDGPIYTPEDLTQLQAHRSKDPDHIEQPARSYEAVGRMLKRVCAAYPVESWKLFRRVVFHYLVGFDDARLDKFSLRPTSMGDLILTPAYGMVCTKLHHPHNVPTALDLYDGESPVGLTTHGFYTRADMMELGRRYGLSQGHARDIIEAMTGSEAQVTELIMSSFLTAEAKHFYAKIIADRRWALQIR